MNVNKAELEGLMKELESIARDIKSILRATRMLGQRVAELKSWLPDLLKEEYGRRDQDRTDPTDRKS